MVPRDNYGITTKRDKGNRMNMLENYYTHYFAYRDKSIEEKSCT
jgi:hypothetical protein